MFIYLSPESSTYIPTSQSTNYVLCCDLTNQVQFSVPIYICLCGFQLQHNCYTRELTIKENWLFFYQELSMFIHFIVMSGISTIHAGISSGLSFLRSFHTVSTAVNLPMQLSWCVQETLVPCLSFWQSFCPLSLRYPWAYGWWDMK